MNFTTKTTGNITAILVNGVQVGTITKETTEEQRIIKGSMLRYAKGRVVTKYFVRLERRHFVSAPYTIASDANGSRTLKAAKEEVARRLEGLTLKG